MSKAVQYTTDVQCAEGVLQSLLRDTDLSEPVLVDAARKGAVWVSLQRGRGRTKPRRLYDLTTSVAEASTVMLNYDPDVLGQQSQAMHCVSDQVNYGIWFKPSGMLCQGSKWSDHTVATQVAAGICDRHCYLVHRLDKAASGLLVIAYTKNALRKLAFLFQQQVVEKRYQAHIRGKFSSTLPLQITTAIDDRKALTTVHSVRYDDVADISALQLSIDTGRKHQIRAHLASLGHPIIGDRLFAEPDTISGSKGSNTFEEDLQLVACALRFRCPFSKRNIEVSIDADRALAGKLNE